MRKLIGSIILFMSATALASQIEVSMYRVDQMGHGKLLGTITAVQTDYGVIFKPNLKGFNTEPAVRGFHVHLGNSCDNYGQAALGHFDPENTQKHLGPYNKHGHLGDIQGLIINSNGTVTLPVLAPKLKLSDLPGHTLIIHSGRDNYADKPKLMGGGGDRVACGIIASIKPKVTVAPAKPKAPAKKQVAPAPAPSPVTKLAPTPAKGDASKQTENDKIQKLIARKQQLQAMQAESQRILQSMQQKM